MNQHSLVRSDFRETSKEEQLVNIFKSTEGIFDIYCQSKDMADVPN